jgi:hypothetical protein
VEFQLRSLISIDQTLPQIIEFCILIVGIFYMMWANINHCPKKLSASGHSHGHDSHNNSHHNASPYESNNFNSLNSIPEEVHTPNGGIGHHSPPSEVSDHCKTLVEHDNQYKSNLIVYADCHAASRGLFGEFCVENDSCVSSNLKQNCENPINRQLNLHFPISRWNDSDDSHNRFHDSPPHGRQ